MNTGKTVMEWEASDHIEDLKNTLGTVNCPAHDAVVRSNIFAVRHVGDMRKKLNGLADEVAEKVCAANGHGCPEPGQKKEFSLGPLKLTGFEVRDVLRVLAFLALIYAILAIKGIL